MTKQKTQNASLNHGRNILAIPGPSVMPDRVLNAMHKASPNIYEGELIEMVDTLFPDLKAVARTKEEVALYISNGHGAWEAAVRNTLCSGDKILVMVTGRFGEGWAELAKSTGIDVEVIDFGLKSAVDPNRLEEALKADTEGEIKAILTVQTDTASSVLNDVAAMRKAIDNAGHDALFMVDCIACLGCDRFEMDAWGVDVMVAACQKGLMTPPGMSFVYFNDKAKAARKRADPGFYWDWVPRSEGDYFYQKFGGTAPTHHLFGLREALTMLVHEEGMENAWARHTVFANAVWAAVETWSGEGETSLNIIEKAKRSTAVSTIATGAEQAVKIRQWCEKNAGVTLGIGLGFGEPGSELFNRHYRIGHMGHLNPHMVLGVLGAIETAMLANRIAHGSGGVSAAAQVIAQGA